MDLGELYRPPDREKYLLQDEIEKLLTAARKLGRFEHEFLCFSANTGVRPSEANRVCPEDVSSKENRVRVQTIKQKSKKKNGKVQPPRIIYRDVDLSPEYAKQLGRFVATMLKQELIFGRSRVTFWTIFKKAALLAGLSESYTLYSLRHSRCIYLLEWTGDLDYTSKQLGHSSLDITRQYLHVLPSKREKYVKSKLGTFGLATKSERKSDSSSK